MSQNIEIERRLAAVLAADVAGYSRLTEVDEIGTMRMLAAQRAILDSFVARHRGRIANTAGDSVLAEFPSAVNAVRCAVEAQQALREAADDTPAHRRVLFRIGIHVGDVVVRDGDLLGNGVNVAARLEALADAGGIVLSAATHEHVKKILPLAYTDLGLQTVKNIEEPVRAFAIGDAAAASPASSLAEPGKPPPLPDKPSIAVLPFQNMSGDPEQEYFADGMVEDIITALSRKKQLFVIARNSTFTYKSQSVDVKRVGRELGVRYLLEGSVRKSGNRVRITGQLIDALTEAHLWADRFDGLLDDIFDLQDQITVKVVTAIAPQVELAEIDRAERKPVEDLGAYDYYLKGLTCVYRNTVEGVFEAQKLWLRAVEIQPTFAIAWAHLAQLQTRIVITGLGTDIEAESRKGVEYAKRALLLDRSDPRVLAAAGYLFGRLGNAPEEGLRLLEQATDLDANFAHAWARSGSIKAILGDYNAAFERARLALRLSPRDPHHHVTQSVLGHAYFFRRDYLKAIACADVVVTAQPGDIGMLPVRASAYALSSGGEAARGALTSLLDKYPGMSIAKVLKLSPHRAIDYRERLASGLRIAGLPE